MTLDYKIINKAVKDTEKKHGNEQVYFAFYCQANANYTNCWTGNNKIDMASISGEQIKEMLVLHLLESMEYKNENHLTQILGVSEEKELSDLKPEEFQFSMYKLYTNGGIEALDNFISNRMFQCNEKSSSKELTEGYKNDKLFRKMAAIFHYDNYIDNNTKDGVILNFALNNNVGLQIYNDVCGYYENKMQQTKNK